MTCFVALLRAVNVGGTARLAMRDLVQLCGDAGFRNARSFIASGNVVFDADIAEAAVRDALETGLHRLMGAPVGVLARSAAEMAGVAARNPFAAQPPNQVMALFTDAPLPDDPLDGATGLRDEQVRSGGRELFIFYPNGMGRSRLKLPAEAHGTARNMNTVTALARMAAD